MLAPLSRLSSPLLSSLSSPLTSLTGTEIQARDFPQDAISEGKKID